VDGQKIVGASDVTRFVAVFDAVDAGAVESITGEDTLRATVDS